MKRKRRKPQHRDVRHEELGAIVDRAGAAALGAEDVAKLRAAVDTLALITAELERKGTSLERLRRMLFGASTERTRDVLGETGRAGGGDGDALAGGARTDEAVASPTRRQGHGRNGADAYPRAARVTVAHETLGPGDPCPAAGCHKGKVYPQAEPSVLVRVRGMAPLAATVYECARLRCNLCGELYTAAPPAGVGPEKYDETASSMIGLLKYGTGLPFHRIAQLERSLGIPLAVATQWDVVHRAAQRLAPGYAELVRQAAQGEVLHNDDTGIKILALMGPEAHAELAPEDGEDPMEGRTGLFTSGIVSVGGGHRIALFFTGRKHAGENLAAVLAERAADLPAPIQMCDGLSRNVPVAFATILGNCLLHARRRYVDVVDDFPEECRYVLKTLREVYRTDAAAREQGLSAKERLQLHQAESEPRMADLAQWMKAQIEEHRVEPNSGLGEAIAYMTTRWDKLTLFLRVAGAPLDNNLAERALKKVILHRKNALFYKTENGARVGDLYMSLIHTAELCGANPFHYLVALQRHEKVVAADPARWMPWSYTEALAELMPATGIEPDPPG
jgi:transposase